MFITQWITCAFTILSKRLVPIFYVKYPDMTMLTLQCLLI